MFKKIWRSRVFKLIALIFLFIIAYFGISQYLPWRFNSQPFSYYQHLADVTIKTLEYEGIKYSIKDGELRPKDRNNKKISQLASYYLWTKEDPIFYSPGINLQRFEEAAQYLDQKQMELLKNITQTVHIYPSSFLSEMAKTAKLTDKFLNEPSDKLATQLIEQQLKAARMYQSEAQSLLNHIAEEQNISAVILTNSVSTDIVRQDLGKILENGKVLEREINLREECLIEGKCQRPFKNFPKPEGNLENQPGIDPKDIIKPEWVFDISSKKATDLQNQRKLRGIYQTKTPCFGVNDDLSWPDQLFYVREKERKVDEPPILETLLANEIFFRRLTATSEVTGDRELFNQGIKYLVAPSDNIYMCPYSGYLAEIATLDLILNEYPPVLDKVILSGDGIINDFFIKAQADEKDFFAANYPSYQNLEKLADDYRYLYRLLSENPDLDVGRLRELKDELLQRYLIIKSKLGQIELVFNQGTQLVADTSLRAAVNPAEIILTFPMLQYIWRNFYDLYFLPFSPSIWQSDQTLKYLEDKLIKGAIGPTGGWISFHQAEDLYPVEEIKRWFTSRRDIVKEKFEKLNDKN